MQVKPNIKIERQIEAIHKNFMYKVEYDQQAFQKFCKIKEDVL